jgi:hypothetical protein
LRYSITSSARCSTDCGTANAKRLGGLQIDDQFEFGRLLDWQIAGLGALQDSPRVSPFKQYTAAKSDP